MKIDKCDIGMKLLRIFLSLKSRFDVYPIAILVFVTRHVQNKKKFLQQKVSHAPLHWLDNHKEAGFHDTCVSLHNRCSTTCPGCHIILCNRWRNPLLWPTVNGCSTAYTLWKLAGFVSVYFKFVGSGKLFLIFKIIRSEFLNCLRLPYSILV